jgi:hypothetical protein
VATFGAPTKAGVSSLNPFASAWDLTEAGVFSSITTYWIRGTGTPNLYVGIYSNRTDIPGFSNFPYELKAQTGIISTVGEVTTNLISPVTLSPGKYWLVPCADAIGAIIFYRGLPDSTSARIVSPFPIVGGVFPSTYPTDLGSVPGVFVDGYIYATYTPVAVSVKNSRFWYKP